MWKSKRFLAAVFTTIAIGVGIAQPAMVGSLATNMACSLVACEA